MNSRIAELEDCMVAAAKLQQALPNCKIVR